MSIVIRKDVQIKEHRYATTQQTTITSDKENKGVETDSKHYTGNYQTFYDTIQYTPIGIETQLEQGENPFYPQNWLHKFDEINKEVGKWISRQDIPLRAKEQYTVINPEYRDDMLGQNLYHYHGESFGKEHRPLSI